MDGLGLGGCLSSCRHLRGEERGGGGLAWPGQLLPQLELGARLGPGGGGSANSCVEGSVSVHVLQREESTSFLK